MSDSTLYAALAATLIATGWLLPMGVIRTMATHEVDRTPGMRNLARISLALGCVSAIACLVIAIVILSRAG